MLKKERFPLSQWREAARYLLESAAEDAIWVLLGATSLPPAKTNNPGRGRRRRPRPLPFEKEGGIWFAEV